MKTRKQPRSIATSRLVQSSKLYFFASFFALIGCLLLFRSYAATQPEATFTPGSYRLADFQQDQSDLYQLGLSKAMLYCFSPVSTADIVSVALLDKDGNTQATIYLHQVNNTACFTVSEDYKKVITKLPNILANTTLTVTKR